MCGKIGLGYARWVWRTEKFPRKLFSSTAQLRRRNGCESNQDTACFASGAIYILSLSPSLSAPDWMTEFESMTHVVDFLL